MVVPSPLVPAVVADDAVVDDGVVDGVLQAAMPTTIATITIRQNSLAMLLFMVLLLYYLATMAKLASR